MKYALFTILILGATFSACIDPVKPIKYNLPKRKAPNRLVKQNTENLHALISNSDTIIIDTLQQWIDKGVDLNYPVPFEHTIDNSPFRPGTFFSFLNGSSTKRWNLNALQLAFFQQKPGYEDAVFYLIDQGADLNHQSKDSMVSLDWINYLELENKWQDTLIALGADPSLVNLDVAGTNLDLIDFYVNHGANPKTINLNHFFEKNYGRKCKIEGKDVWINNFTQVLSYDVNAQALDPEKWISVFWPNEFSMLDELMKKGLDFNEPIDRTFRKRKTPPDGTYWLDYALENRNEALTKYLLKKGATNTTFKIKKVYIDHFINDPELKQLIKDILMK